MYGKEYIEEMLEQNNRSETLNITVNINAVGRAAKFLHENNKHGERNANRSYRDWVDLILNLMCKNARTNTYVCTAGVLITFEEVNDYVFAEVYVDPDVSSLDSDYVDFPIKE